MLLIPGMRSASRPSSGGFSQRQPKLPRAPPRNELPVERHPDLSTHAGKSRRWPQCAGGDRLAIKSGRGGSTSSLQPAVTGESLGRYR